MREEGDHKTIQCNGWMTEGCSGRHVSGRIVDGQIWDAPRFGNEAHENEKQRRDEKTEGPQNPHVYTVWRRLEGVIPINYGKENNPKIYRVMHGTLSPGQGPCISLDHEEPINP